jgi:hypothetical protein
MLSKLTNLIQFNSCPGQPGFGTCRQRLSGRQISLLRSLLIGCGAKPSSLHSAVEPLPVPRQRQALAAQALRLLRLALRVRLRLYHCFLPLARVPLQCGYRRALRLFLQPARAHALLLCRELRALPAQPALFSLRCGALARDEPLPFSQLGGSLVLPPSSSCCEGASACRTWHTCASASSRCRTQAADASCATCSSAASARAAASSAGCARASTALRRSHVIALSSEPISAWG